MSEIPTDIIGASPVAQPTYRIQGRPVPMPVEVRDAVSVSALYLVPAAVARRLVPSPELHLHELLPGRAVCILAAVEYRDNDLGRYNEFAVNLLVHHGRRRPLPLFGLVSAFRRHRVGAYIHWLPVSTTFSRDAGRDIWGFPKTLDQIDFEDSGTWRTCRVVSQGRHVLTLSVRRGGRGRMPAVPQDAFACRDGMLFKTPSVMSAEGLGTRLGGATISLGDHPRAQDLRSLGLPRRALLSTSMETMRASFQAPQRLSPHPR